MHSTPEPQRVLAIMAAHNRRDTTLTAVTRLAASAKRASVAATIVLVDDGSTDGTSGAVTDATSIPVQIITGDGSWFWARSMAAAERRALELSNDGDWLLWLNDDVVLDDDALARLIDASSARPGAIIVGSTRDPQTDAVTYGGMMRAGRHPLAFALTTPPRSGLAPIDTFNGNIVLVPVEAARELGGINGELSHALADIDYGWRARGTSRHAVLAPGTFGTCARNPERTFPTRRAQWRSFIGIKGGGNGKSTARVLRRLAPSTWAFWWTATYVVWWARRLSPGRGSR